MEQGDAHWTVLHLQYLPQNFFLSSSKNIFYKQDFASEVLRFNKFSHIFTFPFVQPPKSIMKHVQKDIKNCQSLTAMPGGKVSGAHFYLSLRVEEVT